MFQADRYIFMIAASSTDIYAMETHPIDECANGNGLVVVTSSSSHMIEWVVRRLNYSGLTPDTAPQLVCVIVQDENEANVNGQNTVSQ